MKRFLWISIFFLLVFGLVGCGEKETKSEKDPAVEKEIFILAIEANRYEFQDGVTDLALLLQEAMFRTTTDGEKWRAELEAIQKKLDEGVSNAENIQVPDNPTTQHLYKMYMDVIMDSIVFTDEVLESVAEFNIFALMQKNVEGEVFGMKWERFDEAWLQYKLKPL